MHFDHPIRRYGPAAAGALLAAAFFVAPAAAHAAPVVTSFAANPTTIPYGYSSAFSWSVADGGGVFFKFGCPTWVTVKDASGAAISCNTDYFVSASANGSAAFYLTNISGSTEVVPVTLTPKDLYGATVSSAASVITVSVGPSPKTIASFTSSAATVASGTPVTLTWSAPGITGVNLQFSCVAGVRVLSVSPASNGYLPCDTYAYATDLAYSGSVNVSITNEGLSDAALTVRAVPKIDAGYYDGTRSESLTLTIPGRDSAVPSVTSFTGSNTRVLPDERVVLSWVSKNTAGVNVKFQCAAGVAILSVVGSTTATLPCDAFAFYNDFPATGSTTIAFSNLDNSWHYFAVTLLPKSLGGTYDSALARKIDFTVMTPGYVATPASATPTLPPATAPISVGASPAAAPVSSAVDLAALQANIAALQAQIAALGSGAGTTGATPSGGSLALPGTFGITRGLGVGSRGTDVSELQRYLARDKSLYPEGTVSGYFGALTRAAVERFQKKYGIAGPGDAGYGYVGPKTRAKLKEIFVL